MGLAKCFCTSVLWALLCINAYSQKLVLKNEANGALVPYASVSFPKLGDAINLNVKGVLNVFRLDKQPRPEDSVYISAQGFIPLKVTFSDWLTKKELKITPEKSISHSSVAVKYNKIEKLNVFNTPEIAHYAGVQFRIDSFNYLQLAQRFETATAHAQLSKLKVVRHFQNFELHDSGAVENRKDTTGRQFSRFRLRIYGIDTVTGGPGAELCQQMIEVAGEKEEVSLNLEKYGIIIPEKIFFVAIEWLRIPENANSIILYADEEERKIYPRVLYFLATSARKDIGLGQGSYPAINTYVTNYRPAIGMHPQISKNDNVWGLGYDLKWRPFLYFAPEYRDLAIAAEVKY